MGDQATPSEASGVSPKPAALVATDALSHASGGVNPSFRNLLHRPRRSLAAAALLLLILVPTWFLGVQAWAQYHLSAGRSALEHYHSADALGHFQAALTVWSKDRSALLLAARAARRLGDYAQAQGYLEAYQNAHGSDDDLLLEQVLLRAQQGDMEEVETYCRSRLTPADPAAPLVLEALARGNMRGYRWSNAETCLKQWQEREPDNPEALLLQGSLESERDNLQESLSCYRRALVLDPDQDEARLRLAELLLTLIQAAEALPHLEYLQHRDPENVKSAVALAQCYEQLGRQEESERMLDAVLARLPNYAPALLLRGQNALRAGQAAKAETWLRQASELQPGDYQIHYQLYLCLIQQGKAAEAQEMLPALKQIDDDLKRIHEIAAVLMDRMPHDPDLLCEAGVIFLRADAQEEGLRWLKLALKEDPRHAKTHRALADYYKRKGNLKLAAEHRERAGVEAQK